MRLDRRVGRIERQLDRGRPAGNPVTVFLIAGSPSTPTTQREAGGGVAREVVFDPAARLLPLLVGLHQLIGGGSAGLADRI